jgi:hypothetical protein
MILIKINNKVLNLKRVVKLLKQTFIISISKLFQCNIFISKYLKVEIKTLSLDAKHDIYYYVNNIYNIIQFYFGVLKSKYNIGNVGLLINLIRLNI